MIDVRAPIEFTAGALPSAANLPLMIDEERRQVGIRYKNNGQQAAQESHEQKEACCEPLLAQSAHQAIGKTDPLYIIYASIYLYLSIYTYIEYTYTYIYMCGPGSLTKTIRYILRNTYVVVILCMRMWLGEILLH